MSEVQQFASRESIDWEASFERMKAERDALAAVIDARAKAWDEGYQFGRLNQADAMIADGHLTLAQRESLRSSLAQNLADQFGTYRDNPYRVSS